MKCSNLVPTQNSKCTDVGDKKDFPSGVIRSHIKGHRTIQVTLTVFGVVSERVDVVQGVSLSPLLVCPAKKYFVYFHTVN